jgi:signal transduction histidine kinase
VAAGIAKRLGIDALIVRIAFVVLTVAGGSGVLLYVIGWLWLPREGSSDTIVHQASKKDFGQTFAIALLVLGGLLLLRAMGFWFDDRIVWPVVLASAGLAVIWRQADDEDREPLTKVAARLPLPGHIPPFRVRTGRASVLRVGIGVALVVGGATTFLAVNSAFAAVRQGLVATAGIVGGIALIFGPWWWRLGKELTAERRERIRSQERAEMATHLHDSVLQTLALIQLRAEDPRAVAGLARRQERELRSWLFGGRVHAEGDSFNAALERISEEVEELHLVAVDTVVVGDCQVDERVSALVSAGREAMTNAAKWSGAGVVSVFAEVEPDRISLFVRDRGAGFVPDAVAPDRRGIAESIKGRMVRHGGTAVVRTALGQGTEVELTVPRAAA